MLAVPQTSTLDGMRPIIAILAIMVTTLGYAESSLKQEAAKLTFDGLGPIRLGMSLKDLQANGVKLKKSKIVSGSCRQSTVSSNSEVRLMFENGVITRVEIRGRSIETLSGVRVGFTEAKVRQVYGSRVVVEPHKYDPTGHYMKVFSRDRKKALVFETDGKRITNFRAGISESAQYVEGCL